jgi:Flp pilus assembly protein TadG
MLVQAIKRISRAVPNRVTGQATVEFALASLVFLLIVFGTIDFGRVAFTYSQLDNAVREGARVGKVKCGQNTAIRDAVIAKSPTLGLTYTDIGVANPAGCNPPTGHVTVTASTQFKAVTQNFLGIAPITLNASAKVYVE